MTIDELSEQLKTLHNDLIRSNPPQVMTSRVNERLKLTRPQHLKVAHLGWRKAHGRDALI